MVNLFNFLVRKHNIPYILVDEEETKVLTLEPSNIETPHDTVFINELKLSEFKQVLAKMNINSEFSGGVLWCCNGTVAVRRVII